MTLSNNKLGTFLLLRMKFVQGFTKLWQECGWVSNYILFEAIWVYTVGRILYDSISINYSLKVLSPEKLQN